MNKLHFADQMAVLGAAFQTDVAPMLAVYWTDLAQYSDEQFEMAAIAHRKTGKFFPRISDLIELIEGTGQEKAHEAWADVVRQLSDYRSASFSPAVQKAVDAIGGVQTLAHTNFRELDFKKRDFLEVFESVNERTEIENQQERIGHE